MGTTTKPGERVKRWRSLLKLKQNVLAERAAMDNSKLSRIERGLIQPSAEDIESIARALGLSMSAFYGEVSDNEETAA